MDASTMAGIGLVAVSGLIYIAPKAKAYLNNRGTKPPHEQVKTLIDYFTEKKCSEGIKASVNVGKLLYEQCNEHNDEVPPPKPNNLP